MPVTLKTQRCRGFSLIEVMVAIIIVGIFAGIALPSFLNMIQNARINSATEDVVTALRLARSEAIQQNTRIQVVPVGGNFTGGFRVERVADTTLIRQFDAFRDGVGCTACTVTIIFNGMGERVSPTTMNALVLDDGTRSRTVNVLRSGGVTTE